MLYANADLILHNVFFTFFIIFTKLAGKLKQSSMFTCTQYRPIDARFEGKLEEQSSGKHIEVYNVKPSK